ncbi:DUF3168 domain-containing protein [Cytobacillus kochii]|uniref:DUF3168 domain-containing protein n=1 Tax=Cytobacillus kochii TaxID=859143 RepID=UPI001CD4A5AE|nr:DUF3168 domain-containing protein [Cytobacillus kochii]MCA1025785.1 DUF3168 domain-containing protein [Cytobacillus kochii]
MAIASIELQKAVFANLSRLSYPVYDALPKNQPMPYILIGEENLLRNDTKSSVMTEHVLTIHAFSKANGTKQVKEMTAYIINSLVDTDLIVSGFDTVVQKLQNVVNMKELDDLGVIQHAVIQIKYTLTEVK